MRKSIHTHIQLSLFAALTSLLLTTGCEPKTETQKLEEKAKHAAEQTGDAVKDAASKTTDAVKDAAEKTGEAIKDGAQKAVDATTNAVGEVKQKLN